jgi:hypothetical protein
MSIRTPLGRVRGLGTAKDGTHHWWMQRVTSVALVPLVLWFVISLLSVSHADYETFQHWLSNPVNAGLMVAPWPPRRSTTPIWGCRLSTRIMSGQKGKIRRGAGDAIRFVPAGRHFRRRRA